MSNIEMSNFSPITQQAIQKRKEAQALQQTNGTLQTSATETDKVEFSADSQAPKIGFFRLAFSRLTDEQIAQVNKTKKLPKNAKFIDIGTIQIRNNFFNITQGTRTLPEGYELRKNWFGFTKVVRKDTEGLFLRKKTEEV